MWLLLLGNAWVRRALAAIGVLALLWMVRAHYVRMGEREGEQRETVQSAGETEAQRSEERKAVAAEIAALREQMATIDARSAEVAKSVARSAAAAQEWSGAQQQAAREVAAIPANDLHERNRKMLGDAEEGGAAYSAEDERKIAACLTERPLCEQRAEALDAQVTGLQQELEGAAKSRELETQQYQALAGYAGELEKGYVRLYNALPRKRNWWVTVVTFGAKGKAKTLAVPSVEELKTGTRGKR